MAIIDAMRCYKGAMHPTIYLTKLKQFLLAKVVKHIILRKSVSYTIAYNYFDAYSNKIKEEVEVL